MNDTGRNARNLVAWILVILAVAALRETRAVTMPLGVGLFLATLAWPLQKRLMQRLHTSLSLTLTLLVFWALLALFIGALVLCAGAIAEGATDYQERFVSMFDHGKQWLLGKGVPHEVLQVEPSQIFDRALELLAGFVKGLYDLVGLFVLVAVYFFLALLEVHALQRKLALGHPLLLGSELLAIASEFAVSIQRFMLTRTALSLVIGLLTAFYTWFIELDFALVWGVSAFLLNYIPIFGAIVAVILPTLLALIHPEAAWLAPATFVGLTTLHVVIGNYVDPWMQGKYLALSPLVLFLSVTFWGWVWGVAGVFISVPLTAGVVILCRHFEPTRWIAVWLAKEAEPAGEIPPASESAPEPGESKHPAA